MSAPNPVPVPPPGTPTTGEADSAQTAEIRGRAELLLAEREKGYPPLAAWGPTCHGCGTDSEFRHDGYCSMDCRDWSNDDQAADVARDVLELLARLDSLSVERASRVAGLSADVTRLEAALEELLDVAERIRGGDPKLDPEQWYAARDFARVVLKKLKEGRT